MLKTSRICAGILAVLAAPMVQAATVQGVVTSEAGKPVAGARVQLEGIKSVAYTNEQGAYLFENVDLDHIHLHVYSPEFIHGDTEYGEATDDVTVDFVLVPVSIENIQVTASALRTSVLESVTPVTVYSEETLRKIQAETLGETLKNTPGVHSTYFGMVASSPVIRGADGPRVKIVQNGLDVSDVSRVGPDHNVAANSASATQVEVLRGPATLQYGSGAIGGVVNVADQRIPSEVPVAMEGDVEANYSTVNEGKFGRFNLTGGQDKFAFHVDGFKRKTDEAEIPGYASLEPDEDEEAGLLENSQMDTTNVTAGFSFIDEKGYVGVAIEKLDNEYGIPGHHHHHDEEEEHDEGDHDEDDHDDEEHEEEGTLLVVDMTRYQAAGELYSPINGISRVKFAAAYTEYEHTEFEDGEVGTTFANDGTDIRVTAYHEELNGWHGVFGAQFSNSDYFADGEEAFTPPTETQNTALFLIEQKSVGNATIELGARVEYTTLNADSVEFEFEADHDEDDHDDHDDDEHDEHELAFDFEEYSFTSVSLSAGVIWEYNPGYSLALTLSRNERAPSQQEMFSAGEHIATQTYEIGLVFDLDEDSEIGETLLDVNKETSTNLDVTLRKYTGNVGYSVSLFYNQADDYIYQTSTGLVISDEHDEDEEEHDSDVDEHAHEDEASPPVYYFRQSDATIYGLEAEGFVDLNVNWRLRVFGDYIRAKIEDDNLPRTPPLRLGSTVSYVGDALSAEVNLVWYDDQTTVANYETTTDGYTMLGASVDYVLSEKRDWSVYLRANNLLDEEARVHTSFIKDEAPLPGRNFTLGTRFAF